jgi:hypothetical protein
MNKLFNTILIAAAVGLSAVPAQAPFGSSQTYGSLIVPVAGGCGVGFHRGPYGGCVRNGHYGDPVVVAPPVYGGPGYYVPGPCGGGGQQYRVCAPNGLCQMICK